MSFNLHRPEGGLADWEHIPPEERKGFQRLAAATHGIATPANALDVIAMGVLENGLHDMREGYHTAGFLKLAGAVAEDAFNGMVADRTGTKSPLGEKIDVITDMHKVARIGTLVRDGFLPAWVAGAVAARKVANIGATAAAKHRGVPLHTSKEGKLAEFAQNAMVFSAIGKELAARHDNRRLKTAASVALGITTTVFAALSTRSTIDYWKTALQNSRQD